MFFQAATSRPVCLSFSLYATARVKKRKERKRGCMFDRHFRRLAAAYVTEYTTTLLCWSRNAPALYTSACNPPVYILPWQRALNCVGLLLPSSHVTVSSSSFPPSSVIHKSRESGMEMITNSIFRNCCCYCLITPLFTWKNRVSTNSRFRSEKKNTKRKVMTGWSRSKKETATKCQLQEEAIRIWKKKKKKIGKPCGFSW